MPSYFWLTSPSLKQPVQHDVPYTTQALREDLRRVQNDWDECQTKRDRDAIYSYLTAGAAQCHLPNKPYSLCCAAQYYWRARADPQLRID
jgi:hypothetical protein